MKLGHPQPLAAEVGGEQHGARPAGKREQLAGRCVQQRRAVSAQLDHIAKRCTVARRAAVGHGGGEVELDGLAVRAFGVELCGQRRRGVDHQQVALVEVVGQVAKAGVAQVARSARSATSIRTSSRRSPRSSGVSWASGRRRQIERGTAVSALGVMHGTVVGLGQLGGAVAAAGAIALDQRQQPRHALLGRRPIGDVLAREGLLVHLRPHVAGVDGVDREARDARRRGSRSAARAPPSRSRSRPSPRRPRRRRRR